MTGQPFSVLDPSLDVARSYFLEASAGTGKTFAIEHLVVRFLLQLEPTTAIDRILVVTFTRAAARELRQRIRRNIERALRALEGLEEKPPYLAGIDEGVARRRLGGALASFDDAPIFTIHAFCLEMLCDHAGEAGAGLEMKGLDGGPAYSERLEVVHDFFRTGLDHEQYSPAQIARVLTLTMGSADAMARLVLREANRGRAVVGGRGYTESLKAFNRLLAGVDVRADQVLADFHLLSPCYTGLRDKNRNLKEGIEENVAFVAMLLEGGHCEPADFDRLIADPVVLLDLIANGRMLKGKEWPAELRCDWLYNWLRDEVQPILDEARQPHATLARMASRVQVMLQQALEEQESLTFDGLLHEMSRALIKTKFRETVLGRFDAAVVDEFQDTDPVQWSIFQQLFGDRERPVVLVGDPKQSIYAFRSADIYAYLMAREVLGEESCRTLATNYRSRPALVHALNTLFVQAPGLIPLPRRAEVLPYRPVQAGIETDSELSTSGAVQFFAAESKAGRKFPSVACEEEQLFPFIVAEIVRLRAKCGVAYSHFAVLISDRYQGRRFREFAARHGVPVGSGRGRLPADSPALEQLYYIYRAALDPGDWSRVRLALSGALVGWDERRVRRLFEGEGVAAVAGEMAGMHTTLQTRGFLPFFEQFMNCRLGDEVSVAERLLRRDVDLYQDLHQLAGIIADQPLSVEALSRFFEELRTGEEGDDVARRLYPQTDDEAVQMMTTFASKGLEFGVVFALGVATRKGAARNSLVVRDDGLAANYASEAEANLAIAELNAEKGRLLYVALTRAVDRVYIPVVADSGKTPVKLENKSPVELLLDEVGTEFCAEGIVHRTALDLPEIIAHPSCRFELHPPQRARIRRTAKVMQSFTGLAHSSGERVLSPPSDFSCSDKSAHTLPAGAATGLLIHELLEGIQLHTAAVKPFVETYLNGHILQNWSDVLSEMVLSALQVEIDGFTILDIDPARMRREMEFLYSTGSSGRLQAGSVTGVIDLFFEQGGKYYLLDWKSNWLGPGKDHYSPQQMRLEMDRHEYGLQAELYSEALRRYLARVDPRPFEECFGGAYYVFVRGPGVLKWPFH